MDNGEQTRSFEALRSWLDGVIADPPRLRLYSHAVLVLALWFGVLSPLGDRVQAAEKALAKAHKQDRLAKSMEHLVEQRERYLPLLTGNDGPVDWQAYLLGKLDATGVRLSTWEPHKPDKRGPFSVLNVHVSVQSQSYESLVDFVDRLEHGERLVRLEQVLIDQTSSALFMTFTMRALAKPGLPDIALIDSPAGVPVAPLAEPVDGSSGAPGVELAAEPATEAGSARGSLTDREPGR